MTRVQKLNPFVAIHLVRKLEKLNTKTKTEQEKEIILTWSRASTITPIMVGHTLAIHNGKEHIPIYITMRMLGYKLGEFAPTRNYREYEKTDDKSSRKKDDKSSRKTDDKSRRKTDDKSRRKTDDKSRRKTDDKSRRKTDDKSRRKTDDKSRR
uniref:Small ribosomal subunit protein uS19c n=1 Tax=Drypetes lateriflora TaxID=212297 RepID=A0A7G8QD55_9ROSI|nr:ribosomal protein S19 [Drypetes lateriflora]QNK04713.1 ribosomal protein S19 [Drypetes lateriflora]